MQLSIKQIICYFILSSCLITGSFSLDCYECNSYLQPECLFLTTNQTNNTFLTTCREDYEGKKPLCRKVMQEITFDYSIRVIRSCGWEINKQKDCHKFEDDDHLQIVCQCFTDGCNSATRSHALLSLTFILLGMFVTNL